MDRLASPWPTHCSPMALGGYGSSQRREYLIRPGCRRQPGLVVEIGTSRRCPPDASWGPSNRLSYLPESRTLPTFPQVSAEVCPSYGTRYKSTSHDRPPTCRRAAPARAGRRPDRAASTLPVRPVLTPASSSRSRSCTPVSVRYGPHVGARSRSSAGHVGELHPLVAEHLVQVVEQVAAPRSRAPARCPRSACPARRPPRPGRSPRPRRRYPVSSSTSTKYHCSSSNCASRHARDHATCHGRGPGRSSVARMPAAKQPSPRKPSLRPPRLDVEAGVHADQLDELRRDRLLAAGLGVEQQRDAGLPGPLDGLRGQLGRQRAVLVVAEQLVALARTARRSAACPGAPSPAAA